MSGPPFEPLPRSPRWLDRGDLAIVRVTGRDRLDLLHRITSNDVAELGPGQTRPTLALSPKARIEALLWVHELGDASLLVSPHPAARLQAFIDRYTFSEDVAVEPLRPEWTALGLIGEGAGDLARACRPEGAGLVPIECSWGPLIEHLVAGPVAAVEALAQDLAGRQGVVQAPPFERLRVHRGIGGPAVEWSPRFNPFEVGLDFCLHFSKGCYVGQEVIARLYSRDRVKRRLVRVSGAGLLLEEALTAGGRTVGLVTSVADEGRVGLAVVRRDLAEGPLPRDVEGEQGQPRRLWRRPPAAR